jgi:hypothetical protein
MPDCPTLRVEAERATQPITAMPWGNRGIMRHEDGAPIASSGLDHDAITGPEGNFENRDDFYMTVQTLEEKIIVALSGSDLESADVDLVPADGRAALLQVKVHRPLPSYVDYACAYLDDEQLRRLRDTIDAYLDTPNV